MTMTYEIRNVYSLADPELVKAADKDDPEALLEGVAMAGLVGVLRQLGDLAEFAAEIFHGLHEEVMTTAARGHGLLVRVQQLESDIPSIERAFLFKTPQSAFFLNSGIDWHPDRQTQQNLITMGDSPRFVLDSYEECRGPPRLFLLDKFDVGGPGACLKRYTDPSVYKVEASSYENEIATYQRDKRIRKTEKKGSRWKGGETSDISHAKLHQLFLEERVQTGPIEPARRVKLKRRPQKSPLESENGESYVNKLLNSPLDSESGESCIKKLLNSPLDWGSGESGMKKLLKYQLEDKHVHAVPIGVSSLTLTSDIINESRFEVLDNIMGASLGSPMQSRSPCVSSNLQKAVCEGSTDTHQNIEIQEEVDEKQIAVGEEIKTDALQNGFSSDDAASETDNYMDALATMDSDIETSINQGTCSDANKDQLRSQLPDSQFVDDSTASEDGNNSIRKRITMCVDSETSTSTDITSPVGTESPSRPFACIEIPFRPRVPLVAEKIRKTEHPDGDVTKDICNDVRKEPNVSSDIGSALKVDRVVILEEVTSHKRDSNAVSSNPNENFDSPRRSEDHQVDMRVTFECTSEQSECLPTANHGLSAFSFVRNLKGDVDNKDPNVTSLPMISLSNILDANKVEYAEKNHSTGSVVSQCSPTHAIISHVDEHLSDVRDVDVEPSETTFSDDVPVAEENAENPGMYPSPEMRIREILDGILHESDSVEVTLPYSKVDETELNNSEIVVVTRAVFDHAVKKESELELEEIESVKIVSVPDNIDENDGKNIEDDIELMRIEEDSNNSEMETSVVVLLPIDVDKNEDNGHSTSEDHSVINHLCIVQESTESGEHVEGNKLLVPSDTCDDLNNAVYVPDNDDKYDVKDLEYDTELKRIEEDSINLETETNAVVLLQVDIDNNEDNGHSTFEDHSVINQLWIVQESIESGEHVEGNKLLVPSDTCDDVYVPDNVDKIDVKDLEDDTRLKGIEEGSLKSEMETIAVGLLPVDVSQSDNDGLSTFESHSVINQFCVVQESNEFGEYGEVNKLLVPSDTCDDLNNVVYVPDNVDKYDGKDLEEDTDMKGVKDGPSKSEMETNAVVLLPVDVGKNEDNGLSKFESHSATNQFCIVQKSNESGEHVEADKLLARSYTSDDLNNDVNIPSSNPKTLQGNSHSVLAERDEKQQVVLDDLGSEPVDTAPCDLSIVKLIDSTPKETVFAEADCTLESKSLEAKLDLSIDQIDIIEAVQSLPLEGKVDQPNGLLYAGGSQFSKLDSLNHPGTHTEPYQVKLTSQHLVQDDNQVIPIHQRGLQSTPESYSVPVSEKPATMELRQPGSHDINLFDQAKRHSTPPFLGFGILPQIAPVKRVSMPPLPPLPPMQWRMRAPPTYGDRQSDDHFPSTFLTTTNVEPQVVGQVDEIRSLYAENQKSQHDVGRFSQMSSPESSLHIEDHDNSSVTSEAMVPQTDSCSIPTYEGKVFLPSPNTYPLPPVADKKPDNFLIVSPSTPNEDPEVVGHSTADEIGNLYTENQKSQYGERSSSQMSLPTSSLFSEGHGNSSVSSEATGIQAAVEIEQYGSISTPSDQEVFSPSTNPYPLPPEANKMHDNITPIFPSTPVKDPQVVAHSTDQIRNLDTQKSFSHMSLLESSVHTEDHDRPPISSEAKFSENLVLQAAASTTSGQENISPSPNTCSSPPVIDEIQNNNRPMKIQRPRSPLIVAVAAHDKTQLRKVSDGATTQTPKGEEHDSILDQIRAKSFKLKPAVQTRPASIQGPRTNLRVAAILEKANAIRQAFAGSDDDDSDDWSD